LTALLAIFAYGFVYVNSLAAKITDVAVIPTNAVSSVADGLVTKTTPLPLHTGAEASSLVRAFYSGYIAGTADYTAGSNTRHDYFLAFVDPASVAAIKDESWYDHTLCYNGFVSGAITYNLATVSGDEATVAILYSNSHSIAPQMVVNLVNLKIVSIKCVAS
jgi:hypothetical protein